jgi:DNA ligase D-like protein (predicted ligase)
MRDPLSALPEEARHRLRPAPYPEWFTPMTATLTDRRFSDIAWIYERKLDGERCLAFCRSGQVRLLSRNRLVIDGHYPEVAEALAAQDAGDFVLDGEIVAFQGGQTSFSRLQRRMQLRDPERARRTGVPVFYYVFDVVHVQGHDTTALELRHRKALLQRLLSYGGPLRFTRHRNGEGEAYWREACGKGWEGVIAKRADGPYEHRRSPSWLKFKCVNEQEFVIGGFTDPKGSRKGLGALLLGYQDEGRLVYAGKVGTGFDDRMLAELRAQLDALEVDSPPFERGLLPRKGVHWVQQALVCQVGFAEWTRDGQLRHPRFEGLREDKSPAEVVRERPAR